MRRGYHMKTFLRSKTQIVQPKFLKRNGSGLKKLQEEHDTPISDENRRRLEQELTADTCKIYINHLKVSFELSRLPLWRVSTSANFVKVRWAFAQDPGAYCEAHWESYAYPVAVYRICKRIS